MNTEIIKISANDGAEKYEKAVELLKSDNIVGMPTETVYGLAGNALSELSVKRIFEAKGRPQDNPLIVHISEISEIYDLVSEVPDIAKKLAEKFWPGPLTMILPKSEKVPMCVTAGLQSVAVRCPSHIVARNLIKFSGLPIAAPSANISGKPSPTKAEHVFSDLNGKISLVIDGGESEEGVESTVISLCGETPKLLRPGNVTLKELESVCGKVLVDDAVLNPLKEGEKVSSPGMKYKHYSPNATVTILKGDYISFCQYVNRNKSPETYAMVFDGEGEDLQVEFITYGNKNDYRSLSNHLFDCLRELDKIGAKQCFVRCPDETTDDLAVLNRLLRAAAFNVIDLSERKFLLGLTGKTGAGKSTVSKYLKDKGAYVIDGDIVAREVLVDNVPLLNKLSENFGNDILENGVLNRKKLAQKAFSTPENTALLNSIMHPAINEKIQTEANEAFKTHDVVIVDAAAIIESGYADTCDKLIVVTAPEEIRKERIIKRDNISEKDAVIRINGQKSDNFYLSKADYVIKNYEPFELNEELQQLIIDIF